MSTLDPSTPRLPVGGPDLKAVFAALQTAVRGAAFWASIPLPLVIVGAFATGAVSTAPLLVVGLVMVNVVCAAIGHSYTPAR